jgi:hypothetical protein
MRHFNTRAIDESRRLVEETRQVCMTSCKLLRESRHMHRRAEDLSRAIAAAQVHPSAFRDHGYTEPQPPYDPYWWLRN